MSPSIQRQQSVQAFSPSALRIQRNTGRGCGRVIALLVITLGSMSSTAWAHARVKRSEPANGARLSVAPRLVRLEFTEGVELAAVHLILRLPSGDSASLSAVRYDGASHRVVVADISGTLGEGAHRLEWAVLGKDGHPTTGTIAFTVLATASVVTPPPPETASVGATQKESTAVSRTVPTSTRGAFDVESPLYVVVRFLLYVAMLTLIGTVIVTFVVVPRASLPDALAAATVVDRLLALGRGSAVALVVIALARLALQSGAVAEATSVPMSRAMTETLGGTTWGIAWFIQIASAIMLWIGLGPSTRARRTSAVAGVGCVTMALAAALSGHAVATPNGAWASVGLDAVHVLAAGGWLGSLFALMLAGIPAIITLQPEWRAKAVRDVFAVFSSLALGSGAVLLLSGGIAAWLQLGTIGALFGSTYGRVLLIKLGILVVVAAVGAYNWRITLPDLGSDRGTERLRRSASAELLLAAAVLAVTAVLTATSPPISGH